jgi:hypothetical protein
LSSVFSFTVVGELMGGKTGTWGEIKTFN